MDYNPALLVANTILHKSFEAKLPINQMKLQKLIYFVFKQYLKQTGDALCEEPFLAWKSGPALRSVYETFKDFNAANINRYMLFGGEKSPRILAGGNKEFYGAMDYVLSQYNGLSGLELKSLSSQKNGAWAKAIARQEMLIKKVDIWNEGWFT